jgi:hypothetical protein
MCLPLKDARGGSERQLQRVVQWHTVHRSCQFLWHCWGYQQQLTRGDRCRWRSQHSAHCCRWVVFVGGTLIRNSVLTFVCAGAACGGFALLPLVACVLSRSRRKAKVHLSFVCSPLLYRSVSDLTHLSRAFSFSQVKMTAAVQEPNTVAMSLNPLNAAIQAAKSDGVCVCVLCLQRCFFLFRL